MDVSVNWWAVVLAMLSSMVIGSVWYAKPVFGKMWMKLVGLDDKKVSKTSFMPMIIATLTSLITAFVLAHVTFLSNAYFQNTYLQDALSTAFWLWLGLTAARFITHDAFELRSAKLTTLNVAHEFVTIMAMGLIIGLMGA